MKLNQEIIKKAFRKKRKNDQLNFIKIKHFYILKKHYSQNEKSNQRMEEIFIKHIYNIRHLCRTDKKKYK